MSNTSKKGTEQIAAARVFGERPRPPAGDKDTERQSLKAALVSMRDSEQRNLSRKTLLDRAKAAAEAITPEEDAAITAAARTDPDAQPNRALARRIGRPRSANPKQSVMLRLDPDVVERFKADGDGWQTRMNDALRKAAGLN